MHALDLQPLHRRVLHALITEPSRALKRMPGHLYCSATRPEITFTSRTVKAMHHLNLVKLDDPMCTSRVELSTQGLALARQLRDVAEQLRNGKQAMAGAA